MPLHNRITDAENVPPEVEDVLRGVSTGKRTMRSKRIADDAENAEKRTKSRTSTRNRAGTVFEEGKQQDTTSTINENTGDSPAKSVFEDLDGLNRSGDEDQDNLSDEDCHDPVFTAQSRQGITHCSGTVQGDNMTPSRGMSVHTSHHRNNSDRRPLSHRASGNMQQVGEGVTPFRVMDGSTSCNYGNRQEVGVGGRPPSRDMLNNTASRNHGNIQQVGICGRPPSRNVYNSNAVSRNRGNVQEAAGVGGMHPFRDANTTASHIHGANMQEVDNGGVPPNIGITTAGNSMSLCEAGRRAMSYRAAKEAQQRHVATRIKELMKTRVFRKCKFITSGEHFKRVMEVVVDAEKPADASKFVRI